LIGDEASVSHNDVIPFVLQTIHNYWEQTTPMAPLRRYLRITQYSVLECRIYLDNPALAESWLLNSRDPVLPRVIESIRPFVLPKLREENERSKGKGGNKKKGVKDVVVESKHGRYDSDRWHANHVQMTSRFPYFSRRTAQDILSLANRSILTGPIRRTKSQTLQSLLEEPMIPLLMLKMYQFSGQRIAMKK